MNLSEKQKFQLLVNILRERHIKIIIRPGCNLGGPAQNGWSKDNKIVIGHPKSQTEVGWSRTASVLLHEYGHLGCWHHPGTRSESQAWKNAIRWMKKYFPMLEPKELYNIRNQALASYREGAAYYKALGKNHEIEFVL